MELAIGYAFIGIGALVFIWATWMGRCNNKTYRDRGIYLDRAYSLAQAGDHARFRMAHDSFEKVSYDDHMYALAWFRDPTPMYGNHAWLFDKEI